MRVRDGVLDVVGNCRRSATPNALLNSRFTQNFHWIFCHRWSRFWEFGANYLKSRLQLNRVPVHETYSAKVRKIATTSKTPSLNRIVPDQASTERSVTRKVYESIRYMHITTSTFHDLHH
jgi:hypothetical protein